MHEDDQRVIAMMREANRPPFEQLTPSEARFYYSRARAVMQPDPPEVAAVRELVAPGPAGAIPLRLYRGVGTRAEAALPVLVFYHGGGWVLGDLESHDGVCRRIANTAGCAVVAVDYRLAPEHRFPAAVEDCYSATKWVAANAPLLGVDASRLAVGGDSAGGNLAAATCLLARDRGGPAIRFQVLIYPVTDVAGRHPSYGEHTENLLLTAAGMEWFIAHYVGDGEAARDMRASPLHADLAGLPPAYVFTVGYDPLCDEGRAYAERLRAAGVAVEAHHDARHMHGMFTMGRIIADTGAAIDRAAHAMAQALG